MDGIIKMSEIKPQTPDAPAEGTLPAQPTVETKAEGTTPTEPTTPPTPPVDYKKKFGESTRENQIIIGKAQELQRQIEELTRTEIPTDEEMRGQYPDWDYQTQSFKELAVKTEINLRDSKKTKLEKMKIEADRQQEQQLQEVLAHPELKGKETKFKEFISKPSRAGVPVDILINAFLFEENGSTPAPQDGSALERGTPSGGTPPRPTDGTMSDDELKVMRTGSQKEYFNAIRAGKIK